MRMNYKIYIIWLLRTKKNYKYVKYCKHYVSISEKNSNIVSMYCTIICHH